MVAYGGLENGYSATQTCKTYTCTRNVWNGLNNGSSNFAAFKALSFSSVTVSGPTYCGGYWATSGIQ